MPVVREPNNPTVADLMTPKQRAWTYAVLTALNGAWLPAAPLIATQTKNVWALAIPAIVLGGLSGLGFTLARGNTPKG